MTKRKLTFLLPIFILVLTWAGYTAWLQIRFIESTDNAYVDADISHVSAQVAGYVVQADVRDNQHVVAGQVLARLDDRQYQAALSQEQANLDSAKAQLQSNQARITLQHALITQAKASVEAANTELLRSQQQLSRNLKLKEQEYSSQDNVDELEASVDAAKAHLDEAKALLVAKNRELSVLDVESRQYLALIDQARARVDLAQVHLDDTQIKAPFSGVIGKRGAKPGQYIQPGQSLYSLVPDAAVWITANFKETQIQHMRSGQPVQVTFDAFPDTAFTGVIDSLSPASGAKFSLLPAENATGNFTKIVQRIPVRVRLNLEGQSARVVPGLSAIVKVDTSAKVMSADAIARIGY